jgi:hypothetical protein
MGALSKIQSAGFVVSLVGGNLSVTPTKIDLTDTQRTFIKKHKQAIIRQLSNTQLQQNIREQIEERAAIMEFDGGLSRADADVAATRSINVFLYRTTEKPNSELTVIMGDTNLDEAIEKLKNQFGDKLISVITMPEMATNLTKH